MNCFAKSNHVLLRFFLLVLCLMVLFACGGGHTRDASHADSLDTTDKQSGKTQEKKGSTLPDWIKSPPRQPGVVYGVGSAKIYTNDTSNALQNAKERSRVELVKKLRVKVSGETTASFSRTIKDEKVSKLTRSVVNEARSSVEEVELSGIEFIRTEVVKSQDQVYVLSRLDTEKAAAKIKTRIQRLDNRLKKFDSTRQKAGKNKLQRLQELLPVLTLLEKRAKLVEKLNMLNIDSAEPAMLDWHRELQDRILNLLEDITIGLKPQGKRTGDLNSVLMQSLLEKGVNVRNSANGDLILQYRTDMRTVHRDGTYFVFAEGSASLLNSEQDVVAKFKARIKGASVEKGLARDRALSKLANKLGENIARSLLQKL